MFGSAPLRCSFCGKKHTEVAKLVAGPGVLICDECVANCAELMSEAGGSYGMTVPVRRSLRRRVLERLRSWLHRNAARRERAAAATH